MAPKFWLSPRNGNLQNGCQSLASRWIDPQCLILSALNSSIVEKLSVVEKTLPPKFSTTRSVLCILLLQPPSSSARKKNQFSIVNKTFAIGFPKIFSNENMFLILRIQDLVPEICPRRHYLATRKFGKKFWDAPDLETLGGIKAKQ